MNQERQPIRHTGTIENMGATGGTVTAFISRTLNLSVLRVAQSLALFSI
jgi:hypothetical protein